MNRFKYKPSGVGTLLGGIIALGVAIIGLVYVYAYIAGFSQGNDIILKQSGIQPLFLAMFGLVILGFFGGFDVGLYVEAHRGKWLESLARRRERLPPPP